MCSEGEVGAFVVREGKCEVENAGLTHHTPSI